MQPIGIRADAFALGQPERDLFLSPEHAVLRDGLLVPVRLWVNGASIQRQTRYAVTYFHVELETHDILVAENLPVESYLETGNRGMFANADLPLLLHPDLTNDQAWREAESCTPFAADAERVAPIWHVLAERAVMMGLTLPSDATITTDAELRVEVAGRSFKPVAIEGGRHIFLLPAWQGALRLHSRHATPSEVKPWVEDQRRLGVMVRRMTLTATTGVQTISVDHPMLGAGWLDVETNARTMWRWMDGNARVDVTSDTPCRFEVEGGGTIPYPLAAPYRLAAEPEAVAEVLAA